MDREYISILEKSYRKGRRVDAKTGIYAYLYKTLNIYIPYLPYLPSTLLFLKVDKVDGESLILSY